MNDRSSAIRSLGVKLGVGVALGATLLLAACGSSSTSGNTVSCPSTKSLNGAGATFPALLYSQEFAAFAHSTCQIKVNYQAVGSGAGISQLLAQTVDFGATDSPMTDADLAKSTNGPILHIPAALGGVAISYNLTLPSGSPRLKFKGETIANIFLGKIAKWNDPAISALNPGKKLPDQDITVVHRSDGSGTTFIWTNYLAKLSPDWKAKVGDGTSVAWPTGVGGKGNEGVASYVQRIDGALGYVEYAYVLQNKMAYGLVKNREGSVVTPNIKAFQAAAAGADWAAAPGMYLVLTDAPGKASWPIAGATFILMHKAQSDAERPKEVLKFFDWAYTKGDAMAEELDYVPLPDSVVKLIESSWNAQIKANGAVVWASR